MEKGSKMTTEQRNKVSIGLKKFFENKPAWNKGLKFSKYEETSAKRKRRDNKYYLNELKNNALRNKEKRYDAERTEEIRQRSEMYHSVTGKGRPKREWTKDDIAYLKENYRKPRLEICQHLGRSWSSVGHKVGRLGLQKYNKWI